MSASVRYIRFVTTETHEPYGHRTGVFKAAYNVLRKPEISDEAHSELDNMVAWFEQNLPVPDKFTTSTNPRAQNVSLSWFKPTATECIQRFRSIVSIIEQHDYSVEMLRTDRPGYVVYEDDFQIVATPFTDTPR